MIKIDPDLGLDGEMASRLETFHQRQEMASRKMSDAATMAANAGAKLTATLTGILGQGVIVLATEMTGGGSVRLITCLIQIAEAVAGAPGKRLEAVNYRDRDATATIVLLRTEFGIEVSIEVEGDWDSIADRTRLRAEIIGKALGINVPIRQK